MGATLEEIYRVGDLESFLEISLIHNADLKSDTESEDSIL